MQTRTNITLIVLVTLFASHATADDPEPLSAWSNITIARVRIIDSSLVEPYTIPFTTPIDRGFPPVEYEPGNYNSTFEVIEVLAGDKALQDQRLETGSYRTSEGVGRHYALAIHPPFQPDEEVVIFIVDRGYGSPRTILGRGMRHLWSNQYGLARPQTNTYEEDLQKIERIVAIHNAPPEGQWDQVRELALHDRTEFSTSAIDTLVTEYQSASPESENRRRAEAILKEIAASPPKHLTAQSRWLLISRLNTDESRDMWYTFMESLATSNYEESEDMWTGGKIKSALLQLAQLASMAARTPDHYPDDVRKRIHEFYALALANHTVPIEERLQFVQRLTRPEDHSPTRFTDEHAYNILIDLLRQSDEAEIEIAAAETLRDKLPLNATRRAALRDVLRHVNSFEAALVIRLHLADE